MPRKKSAPDDIYPAGNPVCPHPGAETLSQRGVDLIQKFGMTVDNFERMVNMETLQRVIHKIAEQRADETYRRLVQEGVWIK